CSSRIDTTSRSWRRSCSGSPRDGSNARRAAAADSHHHRRCEQMIKTLVFVAIASIVSGSGHISLAKGMKMIGDMTEAPASRLFGMATRAVLNPWVLLGVALQASFFGMYLALLSRTDVSQALPMTSLDYVVVALLAQVMLAEAITPIRWIGVGFIC